MGGLSIGQDLSGSVTTLTGHISTTQVGGDLSGTISDAGDLIGLSVTGALSGTVTAAGNVYNDVTVGGVSSGRPAHRRGAVVAVGRCQRYDARGSQRNRHRHREQRRDRHHRQSHRLAYGKRDT